jgi:hypothetical protein
MPTTVNGASASLPRSTTSVRSVKIMRAFKAATGTTLVSRSHHKRPTVLTRNIAQPGSMALSFDMAEGHRSGRWLRGSRAVHLEELVGVRVNREHDHVPTRQFLRIFRNEQGDWCAEIADAGQNQVLVFDHHPTVGVLAILRSTGADIADDVVDQGAEGLDMRQRARRAED